MRATGYEHIQAVYAKRHNVPVRQIKRWMKKGAPLDDEKSMAEWIGSEQPGGDLNAPPAWREKLAKARLHKLELESETIKYKLDVERGKYVLKSDMLEEGIKIGYILTAQLAAMLNDMPGVLAGLSEMEVCQKLGERIELLKSSIKSEIQKATQ
jgi:hypothetical protein